MIRTLFCLTKPDPATLVSLLESSGGGIASRNRRIAVDNAPSTQIGFSYAEVGGTATTAPPGYKIDHNRVLLGRGRKAFEAGISAIKDWKMFDLGWVGVFPAHPPIEVGQTVAVIVSHLGFWSVNLSRIVYTIDDRGDVESYGFAYGTLACHAEQGEERFTVEYNSQTDEVWYDLYAFSTPRHVLAKLGYPISRRLQKRFARDSLLAMKNAVRDHLLGP